MSHWVGEEGVKFHPFHPPGCATCIFPPFLALQTTGLWGNGKNRISVAYEFILTNHSTKLFAQSRVLLSFSLATHMARAIQFWVVPTGHSLTVTREVLVIVPDQRQLSEARLI